MKGMTIMASIMGGSMLGASFGGWFGAIILGSIGGYAGYISTKDQNS